MSTPATGAPTPPSDQAEPQSPRRRAAHPPGWLFAVELTYLAVAVGALVLYGHWSSLRHWVPDPVGPIPLGVLWWGAVGAITVSLTGIFDHRRDWDPYYRNWHLARPAVGAVVGAFAYLVFVTAIRSTGTTVKTSGPTTEPAVYYVIAFIVGYREETFRELLKRATDVLLTPGPAPSTAEHKDGTGAPKKADGS
jgi:hypothetical protein